MEELSVYIGRLLYTNSCVIVPGFGAFISNVSSSTHDESTHTFSPPKKEIVFNSSLLHDDGLLTGVIAEIHKIDYDDAKEFVSEVVQQLWQRFDHGEDVYLAGIGKFGMNEEGELMFESSLEVNFLAESYGLSSFKFPPISYQKEPVSIFSHNSLSTNLPSPTMKQVLKVAAIAIPLIAIVTLIPFNKVSLRTDSAGLGSELEVDSSQLNIVIDGDDQTTAEAPDTDKRAALFYSENQPQIEKKANTEGLTFHIIAGSYKSEENAKLQAQQLEKKGYSTKVIFEKELYRVSLHSNTDKVMALHELRRLRGIEGNDAFWLMSIR